MDILYIDFLCFVSAFAIVFEQTSLHRSSIFVSCYS